MLCHAVTQSPALPDIADTDTDLFTALDHTVEGAMHTTERFIILLYDRTSTATNIDKVCCKLFAKKNNVQLIPLTSAALKQDV